VGSGDFTVRYAGLAEVAQRGRLIARPRGQNRPCMLMNLLADPSRYIMVLYGIRRLMDRSKLGQISIRAMTCSELIAGTKQLLNRQISLNRLIH